MLVQSRTMGVSIKIEEEDIYFPVNQPVEVTQKLGLILLARSKGHIVRLDDPILNPGDAVRWFNNDNQQMGHVLDLLGVDEDSRPLAIVQKSSGEWVFLSSQLLGNMVL